MIKETGEGVFLTVRVTPKSSQSKIVACTDEALSIRLHASPHENLANEELIQFLAKTFHLAKSKVQIVRGEKSRIKFVLLKGCTWHEVKRMIEECI